jgi:DNA-binding transcriptional LysR family regulator
MKLHYLNYFCILAQELHFHRAADRLAISQPPLSAAVKSLEEELGVQLLRRNSKMVELTPAGAAFLLEAREILERLSRASSLVRSIDGGMHGRLNIGISASLIYREVPQIIAKFQAEMPTVDVELHELTSVEQIDKVTRGQLDAGFCHGSQVPSPLKALPLKRDRFVLCVSESHPMANRPLVDLRDLREERFVMFSREAAPSNHDNVVAVFSGVGIHPRTVHSARTWMSIIAMVSQVSGVALVPRSLGRTKIDGVRFIPVRAAKSEATAMLVWNPSSVLKQLSKFL